MLTLTLAVAEFPASSIAVPLKDFATPPVVVTLIGAGQVATPDNASVQVKVIVTGPVLMPLTGVGVTTAVIVGGVLSILTVMLTVAELPALSLTVPVTTVVPSAVTVTGGSQVSTPESASEVLNETVTLVLFQPFALGAGDAVAVIVGGVLSMLTVTLADAVWPPVSTTVPVMT